MNIIIPPPPPDYSSSAFTQIFDSIRRALLPGVSKNEAVSSILLQAPNGTVYTVAVNNSGSLIVTANSGKTLA